MLLSSFAAQERHGEENERYPQRHIAPEEGPVDATRHSVSAPVDGQEQGACQIAQKQFRKLSMLSGLPTTTTPTRQAESMQVEYDVDGVVGGRVGE